MTFLQDQDYQGYQDYPDYEQPQLKIRHASPSLKSLRIHVLDHEKEEIMVGTGFIFVPKDEYNEPNLEKLALVTNFHVASNKTWDGEWLDFRTRDRYPFFLRVFLPSPTKPFDDDPEAEYFDVKVLTGKVGDYKPTWYTKYKDDSTGKSIVLGPEHRGDYPKCAATDIAVIPLPAETVAQFGLADRAYIWDRRDMETRDAQYSLKPTEIVQVIGYPFSAQDFTTNMPVWTSGSVANEVNSGPDERFLVAAGTRPGQSGSPVILYRPKTIAGHPLPVTIPEKGLLLGVYSGRTRDGDDLGFVWWGQEINELYRKVPEEVWSNPELPLELPDV